MKNILKNNRYILIIEKINGKTLYFDLFFTLKNLKAYASNQFINSQYLYKNFEFIKYLNDYNYSKEDLKYICYSLYEHYYYYDKKEKCYTELLPKTLISNYKKVVNYEN